MEASALASKSRRQQALFKIRPPLKILSSSPNTIDINEEGLDNAELIECDTLDPDVSN